VPVPKGSSVTGTFYKQTVLEKVVKVYKERRPRTGIRGPHPLHDNAPAHKSAIVTEYLKAIKLNVIKYHHYSPDLAPCKFWLFQKLKEMLAGCHFQSRPCIESIMHQYMKHMPSSGYHAAFTKWIQRYKKAISTQGEYFEGLSEKTL
jgi:hypothetical protein